MKKMIRLSFAFIALAMCSANISKAAFPIKQETVQTTAVTEQEANEMLTVAAAPAAAESATATAVVKAEKKQSFFGKIFSSVKKAASAAIPQILYVILAILPLGWLGMGINDNWSGSDWVISLVLYILFWLPGLIFTLVKMNKYY